VNNSTVFDDVADGILRSSCFRVNNSTVFDDVADGILVAAKLINQMFPPVNSSITNITLSLDDDHWCLLQN